MKRFACLLAFLLLVVTMAPLRSAVIKRSLELMRFKFQVPCSQGRHHHRRHLSPPMQCIVTM